MKALPVKVPNSRLPLTRNSVSNKAISILLVDDDEISNYITSRHIEESGHCKNLEVITNGVTAFEYLKLQEVFPDLILLDINMPLMNGLEFLDNCMKEGYEGRSKFIILSTSIHPDDKVAALKYSDVIDYVEKPLSTDKLRSIVNQMA